MTSQEFVDALRRLVMDAAVSDAISIVQTPPGRSPSHDLVELRAWFGSLSEADREMTRRMLALGARQAVFGLLAVLDGARKVAPSEAASDHFELRHVHGAETDILSGPQGDVLHELL